MQFRWKKTDLDILEEFLVMYFLFPQGTCLFSASAYIITDSNPFITVLDASQKIADGQPRRWSPGALTCNVNIYMNAYLPFTYVHSFCV